MQRRPRGFRLVPLAALLAWSVYGAGKHPTLHADNPSDAIVRALAAEGLVAAADDVVWVDDISRLGDTVSGRTRAVVRAHSHSEQQNDIYLVRARRSPEGVVIALRSIYPLTKTAGVDETRPVVLGDDVAFATVAGGVATGVEMFDLAGEDPKLTADWKRSQKLQDALTNIQRFGSARGVQRKRYALDPPAATISFRWRADSELEVLADGHRIVVDQAHEAPLEGEGLARVERAAKGKPGDLITWSVDRVRAISWLGPHAIEFLEYHAFRARDWLKRHVEGFVGDDTAKQVAEDLGGARIKPTFTDPEIGWPPAPLKPLMSPTLPNEGVWLGLEDDPFVGKNPGVPSPFMQTFVRTDPQRAYARVYITLWDPRQVAIHMVAGTVEPVSATGEVGTGQIPRTPEVLRTLVAGFNGGFQAVHFEGGMQVSGQLFLPPKPYASTVAEMRDGTTAIGVWPEGQPDIPDEVLSLRQNLTPIVRDGVINPYKQTKWGGTPPGSADNIHTTRSGVCLTKESFVAYFFGNDMSPETLGRGMVAAGCKVAVHLDMNAGHTGFEFYRVARTGELPDLMRPLQGDWEAEARVPQLEGWSFLARRMIKGMPHMLFPRYIGRDGRDFMYLTLRTILPGSPIMPRVSPPEPGEGAWRVKGLPQHGFPYAIATTRARIDPARPAIHARVLKIDPRSVRGAATGEDASQTVVALGGTDAAERGLPSLWLVTGSFAISTSPPAPGALTLFGGAAPRGDALASTDILAGVTDDDGTLVLAFAEGGSDGGSGVALKSLLNQLGCSQLLVPPKDLVVRLGGTLDLDGELAQDAPSGRVVRLVRAQAPGATQLFPDTPVVEPQRWQPLQSKRVRYFGKGKPRPALPGGRTTSGTAVPQASVPAGEAPVAAPAAPSAPEPPTPAPSGGDKSPLREERQKHETPDGGRTAPE